MLKATLTFGILISCVLTFVFSSLPFSWFAKWGMLLAFVILFRSLEKVKKAHQQHEESFRKEIEEIRKRFEHQYKRNRHVVPFTVEVSFRVEDLLSAVGLFQIEGGSFASGNMCTTTTRMTVLCSHDSYPEKIQVIYDHDRNRFLSRADWSKTLPVQFQCNSIGDFNSHWSPEIFIRDTGSELRFGLSVCRDWHKERASELEGIALYTEHDLPANRVHLTLAVLDSAEFAPYYTGSTWAVSHFDLRSSHFAKVESAGWNVLYKDNNPEIHHCLKHKYVEVWHRPI